MRVETRKTLVLTKAEQRAIHDIYEIFNEDDSLNVNKIWNILADICYADNDRIAKNYGYEIKIID